MDDIERANRVAEFDRRELELLRKCYEAKVVLAAPAALHYCLEHDIAPPRWVAEAALLLLCDLLKREKSKRRGRAGGSVARYRQDMIDFLRWNEVDVLRNEQQRSKRLMSEYP